MRNARCLHRIAFGLVALSAFIANATASPDHVDITWMSITNLYFDFGNTQVLADGYITRLPAENFSGGTSTFSKTRGPVLPDEKAVREVLTALGRKPAIDLLITGHNHFDHAFDTATWASSSGARVIGSPTTCLQVRAQKIPADRCTAVEGGEKFDIAPGVRMYVVRWNHSGDDSKVPELHHPLELESVPKQAPNGGLRAGVLEDFPNGGGNRAYLFTMDAPGGKLSWFFQDSASATDLRLPVEMHGHNFGAPLDNLAAAMRAAGVESVDLWIGTGGTDVANLVLPVLKPRAYLPVHWDGLFGAFKAGPPQPFSDDALEKLLMDARIRLVKPVQYMDKWRLDREGVTALDNAGVKAALGFH